MQPLIAAGWLATGAGADARSRLVQITPEGIAKRLEGQKHWKVAQQTLNDRLGTERVAALHTLIDDALSLMGDDTPSVSND